MSEVEHLEGNSAHFPTHYLLRKEQVVIFRLMTEHNRLRRHHLHSKMRIDRPIDLSPCGDAPQTVKHIIQKCRNLADKRMHFGQPQPMKTCETTAAIESCIAESLTRHFLT